MIRALFPERPVRGDRRAATHARAARAPALARRAPLGARYEALPFVLVSPSRELSKNSTDSTSDVDFFVLVAPGRVWIVARC